MWFKNLRVYRFTEAFPYQPEVLNEALAKNVFKPCGSLDLTKYGWSKPLGHSGTEYVHAANGYIMLCAKRQEKVIPSAVIKEALEEKILEINSSEDRHVGRKEKQDLKDEILFTLLPKALTKSSLDYAYIDTHEQMLVVNSSSAKRAEEFISALRESWGSLKLIPLTSVTPVPEVLTRWIMDEKAGPDLLIGEECELRTSKENRVIRCKNQDLGVAEIKQHIRSGLYAAKLAITWKGAIDCIIDEQFSFKRLKYSDDIMEKADNYQADSMAQQFDIDFSIMTLELSTFLKAVIAAFGGLETTSVDT